MRNRIVATQCVCYELLSLSSGTAADNVRRSALSLAVRKQAVTDYCYDSSLV
jgi:hypothetical protein